MKKYLLTFGLLMAGIVAMACTSVIISANRTESGIPLMLKNRDTDCLDNRVQWFKTDSVAFIGLVNAPVDSGEVWAGQNQYGFAICNTAVYNFDEDSVTASYKKQILALEKDSAHLSDTIAIVLNDSLLTKKMKDKVMADTLRKAYAQKLDSLRPILTYTTGQLDSLNGLLSDWKDSIAAHPELVPAVPFKDKEGEIMYTALGCCKTVQDFLDLLDSLPHPLGIQANFGVIDTLGGAIYVEANNWRYVVYDVNEEPMGYRVQTNFAFAGETEGYMGWERYQTAAAIMHDIDETFSKQPMAIGHQWLFNHICRSYRHEVLGLDENYLPKNGIAVDQDFIPRRITSAAVVFEGEAMWTLLGYPACGVGIPALVCDTDRLPEAIKRTENDSTALLSNIAMQIKMDYVFPDPVSNGKHYVHIGTVRMGMKKKPALLTCAAKAEKQINTKYRNLRAQWKRGTISEAAFYLQYQQLVATFPAIYTKFYRKYIDMPIPATEVPEIEQPGEPNVEDIEQPAVEPTAENAEAQPQA